MNPTIDAQFFGGPLDGIDGRVDDPPPPIWVKHKGGANHVYALSRVMRMADGHTRIAIYRYQSARADSR